MEVFLTALITAVSTVAVAFITNFFKSRKDKSNALLESRRDTVTDRDALIKTLMDRIAKLEDRQAKQESRIDGLESDNNELVIWGNRAAIVIRTIGTEANIPVPKPHGIF